MNSLPHLASSRRAPRAWLEDAPSTVLRFENGRLVPGALKVVSLTGGLLAIPEAQRPGSRVKLMFMAQTGPVLCAAEMLTPLSPHRQAFRLVSLGAGDQRRLRATIDAHVKNPRKKQEEEWIEKYRAAVSPTKRPRKRLRRLALAAGVIGVIGLASALYAVNAHFLK
jgi:hypothetical protein